MESPGGDLASTGMEMSRARAEVAKIRAAVRVEATSPETRDTGAVTAHPAPLVRKPRKKRGRRLLG